MQRKIHLFDNGVSVYDDHLNDFQRQRYARNNVHEIEEEGLFVELIDSIPANGCFVNIGSAIGYYTLLAKQMSRGLTVHAVEPLERHRKWFNENILLNGFKPDDFVIHTRAIAMDDGQAYLADGGYSSIVLDSEKHNAELEKFREMNVAIKPVEVTSLDRLLESIGTHVDLLQMDVQGLELDVLRGGANSIEKGLVSTFLIGTHSPVLHQGCLDFLTSRGYTISFEDADTSEQPDGIIVAGK